MNLQSLIDFLAQWQRDNPEYSVECAIGNKDAGPLVDRDNKAVLAIAMPNEVPHFQSLRERLRLVGDDGAA